MIHSTARIGVGVMIPKSSKIWEWVIIRRNTKIGKHVDIYQYANIAWGTTIEDGVYIGVRVVIANTRHIKFGRMNMKTQPKQDLVTICRGARIGVGAIILPGVIIGEECEIGAGAVVTRSTMPYCTYVGNPAQVIRTVPKDEWLQPPKRKLKKLGFIHQTATVKSYGEKMWLGEFVRIAPNVTIGKNCVMKCRATISKDVVIGDDVTIGPHALLLHETVDGKHKPCSIGNRCYIGANASIMPGVTIGDDIIIGAGALVTKSITKKGIYVGIPARLVAV